jgi:hypothetical protein
MKMVLQIKGVTKMKNPLKGIGKTLIIVSITTGIGCLMGCFIIYQFGKNIGISSVVINAAKSSMSASVDDFVYDGLRCDMTASDYIAGYKNHMINNTTITAQVKDSIADNLDLNDAPYKVSGFGVKLIGKGNNISESATYNLILPITIRGRVLFTISVHSTVNAGLSDDFKNYLKN